MTDRARTTLLLAGHGSRNRAGNDEIERFAAQWRADRPEWRIEVCFIEHADVLLDAGLDHAAQDARRVVLIPFILNAAEDEHLHDHSHTATGGCGHAHAHCQ